MKTIFCARIFLFKPFFARHLFKPFFRQHKIDSSADKFEKVATIMSDNSRYKTILCKNFATGYCKYGTKCKFAHGNEELAAHRTHGHNEFVARNLYSSPEELAAHRTHGHNEFVARKLYSSPEEKYAPAAGTSSCQSDKFVKDLLSEISTAIEGDYGIVVNDLARLLCRPGTTLSDRSYYPDVVFDEDLTKEIAKHKLNEYKLETREKMLRRIIANDIYSVKINGHALDSVCCNRKEFVITVRQRDAAGLAELHKLHERLVKENRVDDKPMEILVKTCSCT